MQKISQEIISAAHCAHCYIGVGTTNASYNGKNCIRILALLIKENYLGTLQYTYSLSHPYMRNFLICMTTN